MIFFIAGTLNRNERFTVHGKSLDGSEDYLNCPFTKEEYERFWRALLEAQQHSSHEFDNPNYFEAGTLVVDLIDTKTFKLLQRHHVTRPLLRDATVEVREANIREAVTAVMKNVKVK